MRKVKIGDRIATVKPLMTLEDRVIKKRCDALVITTRQLRKRLHTSLIEQKAIGG